jgi:isopentenyl-diphosphate delta-isomerase
MPESARIVSSESEELILVAEDGTELGTMSKAECHDGDGILHRAFSLFVFNDDGELLLQQRSGEKRLWPLYWSNTCCSHPRAGETMDEAVERRIRQELGFACDFEHVYRFAYHARYGDEGSERELCSVFLGRSNGPVAANPHEIAEVRFLSAGQLDRELESDPGQFTPWFKMEWARLKEDFGEQLARYSAPR